MNTPSAEALIQRVLAYTTPDAFSEPEQLLAAFCSASSVGFCILDRDLSYVAVNHVLAEINGKPAAAHLGKTLREVLGELATRIEPELRGVLDTGKPVVNLEVTASLPSRAEPGHWVVHYFPILDGTGEVKQVGALVADNTGRKRLEYALEALTHKLQQEKGRLQSLLEVGAALTDSKADFGQAFPAISAILQKAVPHDAAVVTVVNSSAGTALVLATGSAPSDGIFEAGLFEPIRVPLEQTLAGQLLQEREARNLNRNEIALWARSLPRLQELLGQGIGWACFIPLKTPRGTVGFLILVRRTDLAFSDQDLDFLRRVASEMALAVEANATHDALAREKERLQVLQEIDRALLSSLDIQQLLPAVSSCLRRTLPHDDFGMFLYDQNAHALRDYTRTSELKRKIISENGVLGLEDTLTGQTFVDGKTRVLNHGDLLKVPFPVVRKGLSLGVRSLCFVQLRTAKGPLGVLTVVSLSDHAFAPEDMGFLEQVAAALAHSVANALAHKALRVEEERLRALLKTGASLASSLDIRQVFPSISAHVRRVKQHEFASLLLRDNGHGSLRRHAVDFPLAKGILRPDATAPLDNSPEGKAMKLGAPLIFTKEEMAAFAIDNTAQMIEEGMQSLCCVPLTTSQDILGTLNFGSTKPNAFLPEDLELFTQVASQVATALENERAYREIEQLKNRLAAEKQYLEGEIRTELSFEEIIGDSPALKKALEPIPIVAASDATVLILGETGTGKELVARAVHRMSRRKERNFIKVNCAAIPTGLLESELFGHEKGAFTGAVSQKIGRMELADHGTLFLDEVGEIAPELQPKLLRVLQDHEFERLGGIRTIKVDVRLIAATNRDLAKSVAEHHFRSDLFYRLNVFPIHLPALRERRQDIPMLVRHFVRNYAVQMDRHIETIPAETMSALINWHWPGNVRELENFIERSVILSDDTVLRAPLAELQIEMRPGGSSDHTLDTAEREHILGILRETGGLLSGPRGAAHRLGLKRTTLQSKMQRLRIVREDYLGPKQI
ncbi:MAG TPA: sigma 54-interacting transcriptional regulator [Candidatus Sulfotelmatobacter sp.]